MKNKILFCLNNEVGGLYLENCIGIVCSMLLVVFTLRIFRAVYSYVYTTPKTEVGTATYSDGHGTLVVGYGN